MNAKDRANFINKVGTGTQEPASAEKICSQCGAVVKGKFCSKCGTPYAAPEQAAENTEAAVTSASEAQGTAAPFASIKNTIQTGINKVGDTKYCLNCGATVKGKFCVKCGTPVDGPAPRNAAEDPGAVPGVVKKKKVQPYVAPPRRPAPTGGHKTGMFSAVQEIEEEPEDSVFAKGLPEWSLEPPHAPVKRKTSKLL